MNELQPLISICVISYNSSDFVLETLESAKVQTYKNIELIVSDDGSSDYTIELCRNWLLENKGRFIRTELITVKRNTGIPANCNRAVKAANGKWIKIIAADDILLENCIEDNVKNIIRIPGIKIQFSKIQMIEMKNGKKKMREVLEGSPKFFNNSAAEQYRQQLLYHVVPLTPSSFIAKSLLEKLDYFDEKFPLIEDYPFWLKCLKSGTKIWFMDVLTVYYRRHDSSIEFLNRKSSNSLIDSAWYRNEDLREKYVYPNFIYLYKANCRYKHKIEGILKSKEKSPMNYLKLNVLIKYLNPIHYLLFIYFQFSSKGEYWMLKKSIRNKI